MKFTNPIKNEAGFYESKISGDKNKKHYIRLNNVTSQGNYNFKLSDESDKALEELDKYIVTTAYENKQDWFGRENIQDATISKAYQECAVESILDISPIPGIKVFDHESNAIDQETEITTSCDLFVEVSHVWFKKRTFGLHLNLVQVKLQPPVVEEEEPEDSYPQDCMFG
jgi:hypothetical protein